MANTDADLKKLRDYKDEAEADLYGIDPKFKNDSTDLNIKARTALNKLRDSYSTYNGIYGMELLVSDKIGKSTKEQIQGSKYENTLDIKSSIDKLASLTAGNKLGIVNEIFMKERSRIYGYRDYHYIHDFISFLPQLLNTISNNIMAPDDFSNMSINPSYDDEDDLENDSDLSSSTIELFAKTVRERLKYITEKYNLADVVKIMINESLKLGDGFLGIFNLDKEFSNMLNENETLKKNGHLSFEETLFTADDYKVLIENSNVHNLTSQELFSEETFNSTKDYINKIINENIIYEENPLSLIQEQLQLNEDFSGFKREINESIETVIDPLKKNKRLKKNKNPNNAVPGSYLKRLDPTRMVKIYSGNTCFGYFYIETLENNDYQIMSGLDSNNMVGQKLFNFSYLQSADIPANADGNNMTTYDPKVRLILDIFLKNISKKIDKKFIIKNTDFRSMLYELIKKDYIIKNKIRIIYLAPDEVIHFYPEMDTDTGMGISIYKGIVFTAKFYICVLLCNMMLKLSRSYERRTIYVDVGLANDMEEAVQDVIRDFKSKEIKFSDTQSLDTILQMWGTFNDIVIPTKNGDSPVKIESTPGTTVEIENDLIEFLKKAIIAGLGVPSAFIPMLEEVEFSRTLSMANGNFLRDTVARQTIYNQPVSKLLRILYKNEYSFDKNDQTDYMKIKNKFPKPSTLGMNSLNEQISSTDSVVQFLNNNLLPASSSDEDVEKNAFTKLVIKELLPGFDINKYEDLLEKARLALNTKKLKDKLTEPEEDLADEENDQNSMY